MPALSTRPRKTEGDEGLSSSGDSSLSGGTERAAVVIAAAGTEGPSSTTVFHSPSPGYSRFTGRPEGGAAQTAALTPAAGQTDHDAEKKVKSATPSNGQPRAPHKGGASQRVPAALAPRGQSLAAASAPSQTFTTTSSLTPAYTTAPAAVSTRSRALPPGFEREPCNRAASQALSTVQSRRRPPLEQILLLERC